MTIHVTAFAAAFLGVPASAHPDLPSPEPDPVPPPVAGSPHTAPPESYAFKWRFDWRGWEGLQLEVSKQTFAPDALTDLPVVRLDEVKLTGTIGGKLEVDAAAFNTTGTLTGFDDGVQLRRARIRARGDSVLLVPFNYRIDLGYASNQFTVTQAYLAFPNLDYIGTLRIGQFQPPMGLDVITSSWDIAFMEPAAIVRERHSPGASTIAMGHLGSRRCTTVRAGEVPAAPANPNPINRAQRTVRSSTAANKADGSLAEPVIAVDFEAGETRCSASQ